MQRPDISEKYWKMKRAVLRLLCSLNISKIIYTLLWHLHITKLIAALPYSLWQSCLRVFYHVLGLFLFKCFLFCWLIIIRHTCCLSMTFLRVGKLDWSTGNYNFYSSLHSICNIIVVFYLCRNKIKLGKNNGVFWNQNQWQVHFNSRQAYKREAKTKA